LSDQMIQGDAWGSRFGQAWGSEETEERRRERSRRQRSHFAFEIRTSGITRPPRSEPAEPTGCGRPRRRPGAHGSARRTGGLS
jgi:hypothetical protein